MLVWIATLLFLLLASAHWGGAFWFAGWLARHEARLPRGEIQAPCAVLMSLRGSDPFLRETVRGLRRQDYPHLSIHVIVDGDVDAVRKLVESDAGAGECLHPIQIEPLTNPRGTCGRKCSALIQAWEQIPANTELIALIDSDVIPRTTWLRELVAPFIDERVGVVTGGQWFEATASHKGGAWIRSLWNAGSLVPTAVLAHAWAGSLAIRRKDFESAKLAELWTTTIVDDGPIARAMHQIGSRIVFEPRLLAVNHEDCRFGFSAQYIARMLTWSRWYERSFWNTAVHACLTLLVWMFWLTGLIFSWKSGDRLGIGIAFGGAAVGCWLYALAHDWVRNAVAKLHPQQFPAGPGRSWMRQFWGTLYLPPTQLLFVLGVVRAVTQRTIAWRGVRYRLKGATKVQVLEPGDPRQLVTQGTDSI